MKTLRKTLIITALAMLVICACIKEDGDTSGQTTRTEINFPPTFSASSVPVRADLYDQNNILTEDNGKLTGDFSVCR